MSGQLLIERREAVALLTIENRAKRNALDPPLLAALCEALARLPQQGTRAVVLTATGDFFSSGFDLAALPPAPADGAPPHPLTPALTAIAEGPLPVVAALNGPAIGGGCELAATCDLRVGHPGVTLTMPPVRLGLVYPPAGLQRFLALVGAAHTRELFLTAAPVSAERALGWGLIDRLEPADGVLPAALALATEMARGAPLAVAGTRRALERLQPPLSPAAERELLAIIARAYASEDAREARAAFREKRRPLFTGR